MNRLFLLLIIATCLSFTSKHSLVYTAFSLINSDSVVISHLHDGKTDEWPSDKFATDEETSISYAFDNDAQNLYIALKVKNEQEQMKMMRLGMNVFFDMKGKKRETLGVQFPVASEITGAGQRPGSPGQQSSESRGKSGLENAKMMFGYNLLGLKLLGFSQAAPTRQELDIEGSVQIAYSWDEANTMIIEYLVPMKLLDNVSSLNQKSISIGFKINGIEIPTSSSSTFTTTTRGRGGVNPNPSTSGSGGRPGGQGGGANQAGMEKMMKEQKFWAKYTIVIQAMAKAF